MSVCGPAPPAEKPDDEETIRKCEALIVASRNRDHEQAKDLLRISDVNVNYKDQKGNTAFHIAARNGDKALLELFLNHLDIDIHTGLFIK